MNTTRRLAAPLLIVSLLAMAGCGARDVTGLDVARARVEPLVFEEGYGDDVYFQAFSGTYLEAVSLDSLQAHESVKSLKVAVPGQGSALGGYAGGVLTTVKVRDFADFNALTFYARSSVASTLNEAGFGNDNTGTSVYSAGRAGIPLTPGWTFVVIPIPSPRKVVAERGMFTFAEGYEPLNSAGHTLWFDDIRYANLSNITNPRGSMPTLSKQYFIGSTAAITDTRTTFAVDGVDVVVNHMPAYFDYASSNPAVAVVDGNRVRVVGQGDAVVTATLDGNPVTGQVTVAGYTPPTGPAPVPTLPAADVVSLYSDTYGTWNVDSWNPHWQWSTTNNETYVLAGNNNLMYTTLNFVGIDFRTHTVDASAMTHLHLDVYAPLGSDFKVKLVAFNQDLGYMIGQGELTFNAASTPAFTPGGWVSLDIPLADFPITASLAHIGQLVLSTSDTPLVLVDNIYWHR